MESVQQGKRILYLDYLRVFATFAVIVIHISCLFWYSESVTGYSWQISNLYDSLFRWAVPVFLMISGSLFLSKDSISIKKIYTVYVPRLLIAYIVWSFIYYLFSDETITAQFKKLFLPDKVYPICSILRGPDHLWFIPLITGIYICIPIIKQIVISKRISHYFLYVSFFFWILIPSSMTFIHFWGNERFIFFADTINEKISGLSLNLILNYVFYFVLGYELSRVILPKRKTAIIYFLGIVGFLSTFLITQFLSLNSQSAIDTFYHHNTINVFLESLAVFEFFKNLPFKENKLSGFMRKISRWSFGTYLIHELVIALLIKNFMIYSSLSPIVSIPLAAIVVFIVSTLISFLIHFVPFLKKYIV